MGILERGGKIVTKVIPNRKKKALQSEIREHVLAGSALFTDALKSYEGLNEFQHEVIDQRRSVRERRVPHQRLRKLLESFEARAQRNLRERGTIPSVSLSG